MNSRPYRNSAKTETILAAHDAQPFLTPSELALKLPGISRVSIVACLWRHRPFRERSKKFADVSEDRTGIKAYDVAALHRAMNGHRFNDAVLHPEYTGTMPHRPDHMSYTGCSAYAATQDPMAGIHLGMKAKRKVA